MTRHPPSSTLFPYPPLFRSRLPREIAGDRRASAASHRVLDRSEPSRLDGRARARPCVERARANPPVRAGAVGLAAVYARTRSEEHTSELQSLAYLVCRLLLA